MSKKMSKLVVLMLVVAMIASLVACGTTQSTATPANSTAATATNSVTVDNAKDSSDLPNYQGTHLSLAFWRADAQGFANKLTATNDVVWKEIDRVTGVKFDPTKSYDNNGQTEDAIFNQMAASSTYPDVITGLSDAHYKKLVDEGKIWDLTTLLPQYAPNVLKLLPKESYPKIYTASTLETAFPNKIFCVPTEVRPDFYLDTETNWAPVTKDQYASTVELQDPYMYVWVRDDILKDLYPNAKSVDELKNLYVQQNGKFTMDQVLDVDLKSKADFMTFLSNIKKDIDTKNIKEGNKKVSVTFATNNASGDNWSLLTYMGALWGWNIGQPMYTPNYQSTFYDKLTGKVEYLYKTDNFKTAMSDIRNMLKDGIMSPASLVDDQAAFQQKLDNGEYAVVYPYLTPNNSLLKQNGKTYQYRRVYMDWAQDPKFIFPKGIPNQSRTLWFTKNMSEAQVIQTLKMLNYLASDVGRKMVMWGPSSAGLFTETSDGTSRTFKDKDIEKALVYKDWATGGQKAANYGLVNNLYRSFGADEKLIEWPWVPAFINKYQPTAWYNKVISASDYEFYFRPGRITPAVQPVGWDALSWEYSAQIPDFDKFYKNTKAYDTAIRKMWVATSDAAFETEYNNFIKTTEDMGLNDTALAKCDQLYRQLYGQYIPNFK